MNWKHVQPQRRMTTLLPTTAAQGPNTYLGRMDFNKMLLLAIAVHAAVLGLANLVPAQKVNHIPVHSLSFKIGENQRIQTFQPKPAPVPQPKITPEAKPVPKPVQKEAPKPAPKPAPTPSLSAAAKWKPATTEQSVIKTNTQKAAVESVEAKPLPAPVPIPAPAPVTMPLPPARQVPQENMQPATAPAAQPATQEEKKESSLFDFLMLPINAISNATQNDKPAIAETPQQYVRTHGAAPAAPSEALSALREQAHSTFATADAASTVGGTGVALTPEQEVRARYEQTISAWIQQHKIYPASARGREGRVVLRVRIDRQGYVRYYALEESSGVAMLNSAAIDMVRRANPVPAVPENYPAGNLIEFLIPITFEAP